MSGRRSVKTMATCVTFGTELHPERAEKYDYCTMPACQEQNAKSLTIVAVGQNKAADEYTILDDRTREEMASGRYHDQRRASFGTPSPTRGPSPAPTPTPAADQAAPTRGPARPMRRTPPARQPKPKRRPWSRSQEKLALLYNEQGLRPDEIARRLGLSTYTVTQIILAGRNRRIR
jgi:hypothetical protein